MKRTVAILITCGIAVFSTGAWRMAAGYRPSAVSHMPSAENREPIADGRSPASAELSDEQINRAVDEIARRVIAHAELSAAGEAGRIALDAAPRAADDASEAGRSQSQPVPPIPAADDERAEQLLEQLMRRSEIPITQDLIDRSLAVANEIDPVLGRRLQMMCGEDPHQFEQILQTTGRRLIALAQLRERAPDLYDMKMREWRQEIEITRVARELVESRRSDGDPIRLRMLENDLRTLITNQVVMQIKARGDYLRRLEEHVQTLYDELEREATNFEQTVERRIQDAIRRARQQHAARDGIDLINLEEELPRPFERDLPNRR